MCTDRSRTALYATVLLCVCAASAFAGDAADRMLYWTDRTAGALFRAPASGNSPDGTIDPAQIELLADGLPGPQGIAVDPIAGHVYWADTTARAIFRADLDGENAELFFASAGFPKGLDLDPVGRRLVYADPALREIIAIDLVDRDASLVAATISPPQDVRIDPRTGRILWLEPNDGVYSIRSDGSGLFRVTEEFPGQATVFALATDSAAIYWGAAQRLRSTGSFGGCADRFSPLVGEVKGIAFDTSMRTLFWVEEETGSLHAADSAGDNSRVLISGLPEPWRLAVGPRASAPSIIVEPVSVVAETGQAVTLAAEVAGTGPLELRWFVDGKELRDRGGVSGSATDTLVLAQVSAEQIGAYFCVVTSPFGSVVTESAVLAVRPPAFPIRDPAGNQIERLRDGRFGHGGPQPLHADELIELIVEQTSMSPRSAP